MRHHHDTTVKLMPGIERAAWRMIRSMIDGLSKASEPVAADALRRHERSLAGTMAQIIAKETGAQELLEALQEIMDEGFKNDGSTTTKARAAIAKASPKRSPEVGLKPWREPANRPVASMISAARKCISNARRGPGTLEAYTQVPTAALDKLKSAICA